MESGNRQTAAYVRLTRVLALLFLVGLFATFYQGHLAKRNANSAQTSADAAKSAASTAKATLDEMQGGQGAQDMHTLAEAAQTHSRTSLWTDQRSSWHPSIPLTRFVESYISVETYLRHTQSVKTIPASCCHAYARPRLIITYATSAFL